MDLFSILSVSAKRLWNNKGLTLCAVVGMTVAVALIASVPLYSEAANLRVLQRNLDPERYAQSGGRSPFAFMYRYIGSWHGPVEMTDTEAMSAYVANSVAGTLGLPARTLVRYVATDGLGIFPASDAAYTQLRQPIRWMSVGFASGLEEHINIVDGAFPTADAAEPEIIDVLVGEQVARAMGLHAGEIYVAFRPARGSVSAQQDKASLEVKSLQVPVRIAGIWTPRDARDEYWFYAPETLGDALLTSEEVFRTRVAPAMPAQVETAVWYLVLDGDDLRADDVPGFLNRITQVNSQATALLSGVELHLSPDKALRNYYTTTRSMTVVLYFFSVPILGLVLYFIGLISGLIVERQRGEISVLKSRGTGDLQVIGIYVLEGLLVGGVGLAAGLALARGVAVVMGNTVSFLTFQLREPLNIRISPRSLRLALAGVAVGLAASLLPAIRAARLTIVTYKRERARAMLKPVWQRYFLDIALLVPAGYGYYVLSNRGTLGVLSQQAGGDPFSDPLLFLVPALTILAFSLMVVRVFPLLMEALGWAAGRLLRALSVVLALRQLARVASQYTGALLLLVLTLSLATFTASMARTLDQSVVDHAYYKYGADFQFLDEGETLQVSPLEQMEGAGTSTATGAVETEEPSNWAFVPVSEHLKAPSVTGATRVGEYIGTGTGSLSTARGAFYGIDRLDFPQVAFFRRDLASSSLGELMNRLALDRSALLVNEGFLTDHALRVGDRVDLNLVAYGERATVSFVIADAIRYFPTWYAEDTSRYCFVGNLDYVFERLGGVFPYQVWITAQPGTPASQIRRELSELDINATFIKSAGTEVAAVRDRPERAGVFGILSVGFAAAALLTTLGFVLHSLISFRRRYIEFGVLRAIGLSLGQMVSFLGLEQLLLIGTGVSAGTVLGVWVSRLFIPFLQVGTEAHFDTPPFVILIAWNDIAKIYVVFGAVLVLAVVGMIWLLMRLKIFEAVKLGEAV